MTQSTARCNQDSLSTDHFASEPLFFDRDTFKVSRDLRGIGIPELNLSTYDPIGFWEGFIWDCCLLDRTIYRSIGQLLGSQQLTSGPSVTTSVMSCVFFEGRYLGLPEEDLVERIHERLSLICRNLFDEYEIGGNRILLPISGGLDSRLLAGYLSKIGDPSRFSLLTFASAPNSLELIYAGQVAKILGFDPPKKLLLSRKIYESFSSLFFEQWGGNLSVSHVHLLTFLTELSSLPCLVSGFYADALAGYAATPEETWPRSLEESAPYQRFSKSAEFLKLDDFIVEGIRSDLSALYEKWKTSKLPISFPEYFYFTQRQAKTFGLLLETYRSYVKPICPFADKELMELFLALPNRVRVAKSIMRELLLRFFPELSTVGDLSSSLPTGSWQSRWTRAMRIFSGRISMLTALATNDGLRPISRYTTEDVFGSLRVEARLALSQTAQELLNRQLITPYQAERLTAKPKNSLSVALGLRLLTFAPIAYRTEK